LPKVLNQKALNQKEFYYSFEKFSKSAIIFNKKISIKKVLDGLVLTLTMPNIDIINK